MLDNYTVTENSDNRFRFLPLEIPETITLGSDCCQRIRFPFLLHDLAAYSVIYKQGVRVILEKYDEEVEVKEYPDKNFTLVSVALTADETLLFNNTVLSTYMLMKFIDKDNNISYSRLCPVTVLRSADIPVMDKLGIIQKDYSYADVPTYRWIYNNTKVKAVLKCLDYPERDIVEIADVSETVIVEPSCTEEGLALLTAEFTNTEFEPQQKEIPVPAIGHDYDYDNPEWEWEDTSAYRTSAVMIFRCKHDYKHAIFVAANIVDFETVEIAENDYMNVYQLTATYNDIEYFGTLNVTGAFAGWYHDREFTNPFNTVPAEGDEKYAKIIDPHTFDVKVQVGYQIPTEDFIALRFVSSADSTKYHMISFELEQGDITASYPITSLYQKLTADYSHDIPAMTDVKVFSEDSKYFAATKKLLPLSDQFDPYSPINIRLKYSLDSELIDRYGALTSFIMVPANAKRFAGWYKDIDYTIPFRQPPADGEEKFAKFIDCKAYDLKYQVGTKDIYYGSDLRMRVFSSVDSDNFKFVNVYVKYTDTEGAVQSKEYRLTTAYASLSIDYNTGLEPVPSEGETINDVFDNPDSKYFISKKVLLPNYLFGSPIDVSMMLTTCDTTEVDMNSDTIIVERPQMFVGWYHDPNFTDPFIEAPAEGEIKYAKYVNADVFKLKLQTVDVNVDSTEGKFRVYTSLDSNNYRIVKFNVMYGNYENTYSTEVCYKHLAPVFGLPATFNPKKQFCQDSEYFASERFILPLDSAITSIAISSTFITLDGTTFNGDTLEYFWNPIEYYD